MSDAGSPGSHLSSYDDRPEVVALLANIKSEQASLEALLADVSGDNYEDWVYRFYHQSFKVFWMQSDTQRMVDKLKALAPGGRPMNAWFVTIVADGTGKTFALDDNQRWLEVTRPIVEAFFHARYFLEMAVRYGPHLDRPPSLLPSGWAALLYLYDLR